MRYIREYKKARSIEEARDLLTDGAAFLSGGTRILSTKPPQVRIVIDIGGLGLNAIGDGSFGATARLQDALDAPGTPDMLREALRHHLPWTWRNAATVGGECVFGGGANDLLVALLALDGHFVLADGSEAPLDLAPGGLVTEVRYRKPTAAVFLKASRIKTDKAIVNAASAMLDDGPRLVLGGIAATPVVLRGKDLPALDPPGDFRGSSAYRRQVAGVLAERAWEAIAA
jgi:CO/xanthine dehydrogenase FAD-binding subunit